MKKVWDFCKKWLLLILGVLGALLFFRAGKAGELIKESRARREETISKNEELDKTLLSLVKEEDESVPVLKEKHKKAEDILKVAREDIGKKDDDWGNF